VGHNASRCGLDVEGVVALKAINFDAFFGVADPDVQTGTKDAVFVNNENIITLGTDGDDAVKACSARSSWTVTSKATQAKATSNCLPVPVTTPSSTTSTPQLI